MQASLEGGWMQGVRRVPSPNFDARPSGVEAELIVVHGISLPPGEFGGPWIDRLFTNELPPQVHPYFAEIAMLRVSSHLCIRRDGTLTQYVSFDDRAWHAGRSSYQGREACNDFSIGIELEGTDTDPYELAQYRALADCVTVLLRAYPRLSASRLVGHSDIAPGRKSDPGPSFDWGLARALIGDTLNPPGALPA
ncbi:MAG TPA: 1,6-anhydro-N-acetylmuramyl-L-alanine amidase AmpD [Steroidobacteraceae bacterium]|nr:1,6-anhydro-N-acetylmuramyl-L-alanine amidase AmpD [Steroidobacteraceae bacterium]